MKKLFIMLAAAATVVSCANEETISRVEGEAIEFGNVFVDNATRAAAATDPSYSANDIASFKVYGAVNGVNIFNGNTVTKGDTAYGNAWSCDAATQYWINGASYIFDAVVDADGVTTDNTTGLPTSLSYVVANQKDMLYNRFTTTGKPVENNGLVAFTFDHLLSKVKFSVKNTTDAAATNYRINVTEAKLTNVYPSGDYAVPAGTWAPATATDYVLEDLIVGSAATEYHSKEVLLIPGSAVGVYVKAQVEATSNGTDWKKVSDIEKTFTAVLGNDKVLEANKAYNFIVSFGIGDPIQFTVEEQPSWNYDVNNDDVVNDGDNVNLN